MNKLTLSVKQIMMVTACNTMAHTQLSDLDLDSVIGVNTESRNILLAKLNQELEINLRNGLDHTVSIDIEDEDRLALYGIIANGNHWFNIELFKFDKDDTEKLLEFVKDELAIK
jgi:hypothetical protein